MKCAINISQQYELKDQDTRVILYFDNIDTKEVCPRVQAVRQNYVENLQYVPVTVYDYYKNRKLLTYCRESKNNIRY